MDYEKKYKEALERGKEQLDGAKVFDYKEEQIAHVIRETVYAIFPELKESEGERIRKGLIKAVSATLKGNTLHGSDVTREEALAWLEKQGEQNTTDKVEPKFKVGDWISGYYTSYKVLSINSEGYVVEDIDGNKINILFENEKFHHLWTIRDSKDGDVLAWDNSKCIALFKNIYDKESFNSHGFVGHCTGTFELGAAFHDIEGAHPATKEQRDTLFAEMHKAGYMWDSKSKQLLSLKADPNEQKPAEWNLSDFRTWQYIVSDVLTKHDGIGQYLDDGFCKQIAKYMQEEWSKKLNINQQPAEWSEEDEENLRRVEFAIMMFFDGDLSLRSWVRRSKSIRPQNHWKPSDEQIRALHDLNLTGNISYAGQGQVLIELYNDLKKLKN